MLTLLRDSTPLPVDAVLPSLRAALATGHAVLTAPPGSGKTTRVPPLLLDEPWLAGGTILMLEPRRPAARMAAARMADLLGEAVGERVGYQVRFERRIGPRTRIQVLTEGILTRRLQGDPGLDGVGLLIFDEFHERSLQADLGLALALDVAGSLRPDLRILIMSATLDAAAAAALLGDAPVIEAEGRPYPVDIRYAETARSREPAADTARAVRQALAERDGDLLVFLPGAGEIERVRRMLAAGLADAIEILPLHGSMSLADQQRALLPSPGGPRRVILATDIAETSLTIEGVTTVIDSGLARKPRFDPGSGLTRLITEQVPLASADQRAGRAGRLGPGSCYRLWTRGQEVGRPAHRRPEILEADLAPLVLELRLWGIGEPNALTWLDPPPAASWDQAVRLLESLGALDSNGALTEVGRRIAELPVHPRLGRMLVAGQLTGAAGLAADLAALLSERDGWSGGPDEPRPADLGLRLAALEALRRGQPVAPFHRHRLAAVDRLSTRLEPVRGRDRGSVEPGALLAAAYPDRIARRRGGRDRRYLLSGGAGAELPLDDALAVHDYLVAADLDARGSDARIRLALPVSEPALREALAGRIIGVESLTWDPELEAVTARRETRLGALVLDSRPLPVCPSEEVTGLLLDQIEDQAERAFDKALSWIAAARQLQARVLLLRGLEPEAGWPDLSDAALRKDIRHWLAPWLAGKRGLADVRALRVADLLRGMLDWGQRQRLDLMAPESLATPAGNRRTLDYSLGPEPVLAAPLQELFGAPETPRVCDGRVPVLLHLLSPAGRPVQVTRDLAGFWERGYAEVRKELRGRYPKHHWPEDPRTAAPVAGGMCRRR